MSKLTCLVCLQKFPHLSDDNLTASYEPRLLSSPPICSEENLYTRFLHFCTRHLKLTSLPLNGREDEVFCPECKCLVSCLCDLWHEMEVVKLHLGWKMKKLGELFKVLGKNSRAEKNLIKQLNLELHDPVRVRRFRADVKQSCARRRESTPKVVVSNRILPELWKFSYSETKSTLARLIFIFALALDKEASKERNSAPKREACNLTDAGNYSECEDFNNFTDDKDSDYSIVSSPSGLDSDAEEFIPAPRKKLRITSKRKIKMDNGQPKKWKRSTENLKCSMCPQTFRKSTRLVEHLKLSHNIENPSFKCQICNKLYKTFYSMRLHRKNAHDKPRPLISKRPYRKCNICGDKFNTFSTLEAHMISEHETAEKSHSCWFCSESFSLKETLLVHRWTHNRNDRKMFVCDHINCQQSFQYPDKHEQHLQSHLESAASPDGNQSEAIHHCAICNLGFFHPELLEYHKLNHFESVVDFNCPKCPKSFTKKQLMLVHYNLNHLPSSVRLPADRKFKCDKCDYSAFTRKDIQRHTKMHQDKEPLECDQCGVICHGLRAKQIHLRDEHQQTFEEYPCPACGKTFVTQEQVTKHVNGVHREKKFFCDFCGEGFRTSYCLRKHKERRHDPNRTAQNICSTCGKAYMTSEGLKYHINSIHVAEEEKGFGCPYCQKRYHRELLAKVHVKSCMKRKGIEVPDDLDKIEVEWSAAAVEEKVTKGVGRQNCKLVSGRITKRSKDGSKSFEKFLY